MEKNKEKKLGQINTPDRIVSKMLDFGAYNKPINILEKHIMDNSCGNGQFLSEIVRRYIKTALEYGKTANDITGELSKYIHGIEIDEPTCNECKERLSSIAEQFGIVGVNWDIICANTLLVHEYDGKMDYVFGNPPYVRVHNVKGSDNYDILKGYTFAEKGSSDLYLAFYECGLKSLNENGTLCYITPSSWLSSASGKKMRDYVLENRNLYAVVDFEHTQVFDNAQTYSIITLFHNGKKQDEVAYNLYENHDFNTVSSVTYDEIIHDGAFRFVPKEYSKTFNNIDSCNIRKIRVKNGLATLNDKVFIDEIPKDFPAIYYIPVIKASTGKWGKCLFPYEICYDRNIESIPLEDIESRYPYLYKYIMLHEEELKARTYDKGSNWWELGRSQGLSDTFKDKIAINNLTKGPGDIKITAVPAGSHVYSGFYILTDTPFNDIKEALHSKQFFNYVKALKKYKSGEYYTFSSKDVEKFLNYWIYGRKQNL